MCNRAEARGDEENRRAEEEYTWKHRQPGRVISVADRVPRQASVLARVLERHIGQEENLQLLVGGVNTGRLWRRRRRKREERSEPEAPKEETPNAPWRKRKRSTTDPQKHLSSTFTGRQNPAGSNQEMLVIPKLFKQGGSDNYSRRLMRRLISVTKNVLLQHLSTCSWFEFDFFSCLLGGLFPPGSSSGTYFDPPFLLKTLITGIPHHFILLMLDIIERKNMFFGLF